MKIAVIEDEVNIAEYLCDLIKTVRKDAEIAVVLHSFKEALAYFRNNGQADLIFSDIRLQDGLCFDIFEECAINKPVVFTTAYDEYLMKSFDYNNIYYILKPLKKADIENAFAKYDRQEICSNAAAGQDIVRSTGTEKKATRLIIETPATYIPVSFSDIIYIESDFKASRVYTRDGAKYPCSMNLKKLEEILDPELFVRVSRQWILKIDLIEHITKNHFGKYRIALKPGYELEEVEVSKDRVDRILDSF